MSSHGEKQSETPQAPTAYSRMKKVEAVSGEFETNSFAEPANQEEYVEDKAKRTWGKEVEHQEEIDAWLEAKVWSIEDFKKFKSAFYCGVLTFNEGVVRVSKEKILDFVNQSYSKTEIIDLLVDYELLDESEKMGLFKKAGSEGQRWIEREIPLPRNRGELFDGEHGNESVGGGSKNEQKNVGWMSTIALEDGTQTTPIEVYFTQKMKELGVRRKNDVLVYTSSETGKEVPFHFSQFLPGNRGDIQTYKLAFVGFRNLLGKTVFESDFRFNFKDRFPFIQLKAGEGGGDISLNNGVGGPFKYYVGRRKLVFGEESQKGDTYAVLDRNTGGYFRERNGQIELVSTFQLATEEDYKRSVHRVSEDRGIPPQQLRPVEISSSPYARKKLSVDDVREYDPSDYVSPYTDEDHRAYAKRITRLSNTPGVITAINRVFVAADLDHLDVSWAKKIRLAEIIGDHDEERVAQFAEEYGMNGLILLLAGEADRTWAEKLITLGEAYKRTNTQDKLRDIIDTFAPLITDEEEFEALLDETTVDGEVKEYLADLRKNTLGEVSRGFEKVVEGKEDVARIRGTLESGTLGNLITLKVISNAGLLNNLEDLRGSEMLIQHGDELEEDDIKSMRAIYSINQADVGAHDAILAHFDERVKNPDARFYIFKWQSKIQSFIAFEPSQRTPGALEVTSFNVDPSARGYKIGESMLEESIAKEANGNILECECYANLAISSKYIETGWVAEAFFVEPGKKDGTTDKLLNLIRDDTHNEVYWGKSGDISQEQIVRREKIPPSAVVVSAGSQEDLPFEAQFAEHRVLTRMFKEPSPGRRYFAVFESYKRKQKERAQASVESDATEGELAEEGI